MHSMTVNAKNILELALGKKLLDEESAKKIKETAAQSGAFLEDALIGSEKVNVEDIARFAGEIYGMPYIDLSAVKIPFVVLSKFPEEIARKYNMVVFETISDQMIKVAVSKPWDPVTRKAFDFIKSKNNINVDPYVASQAGLEKVLEQYKNPVLMEKDTGATEEAQPIVQQTAPPVGEKKETSRQEEKKEEAPRSDTARPSRLRRTAGPAPRA